MDKSGKDRIGTVASIQDERFLTHGVGHQAARDFLDSPEGMRFERNLVLADPSSSLEQIRIRAIEQLSSGRTLPRLETINDPLVKLVPSGSPVSPYSPYFTRATELDAEVAAGRNLADRFGLPVASEASRYDVYRITPNGPTEVFVTDVAPTSERGGQVTRHGGAMQVLVPNRAQFSTPELVKSIDDPTHVPTLAASRSGLSGPALARGAVAVGVVVAAADAYSTGRDVARAYSQDNPTAAEAKLIDFSARTGGGVAGAGLGFGLGSTIGTPILGGTVGGVVGYVGGDAIAEWRHREAIYAQRDAQGREWRMDPEQPEQGWQRIENRRTGAMQSTERIVHQADAAQASELNYKASTTSLELALGAPQGGRNPYQLDAVHGDPASHPPSPWNRDPSTGQWSRQVLRTVDDGTDLGRTEKVRDQPDLATPERAAQLEAQSRQIIETNAAMTAPVMAARFAEVYRENGWAAHGPVSPAIAAARTRDDGIVASNGHRYERDAQGQWKHDGMLLDHAANPLIHRELEATRAAALRQADALNPSPRQRERAPEPPSQRSTAPAETPRPSAPPLPADFAPPQAKVPDLRDATHPGHHAFNEMVHRVHVFESQHRIPHGDHSERLGAALLHVAVENRIHYQSTFFERDAASGRVQMVEGVFGDRSPVPKRVDLDMARLSSQPIEESSRLTNEAVSRHYASPAPAQAQAQTRTPEQSQALAGLSLDDKVMFGRIRGDLPGHIGDDHVLQAMAAAKRSDIRDAQSIGGVMLLGDHIRVMGRGDAPDTAQVNVTQPAPKPETSVAAIQTQNQQQAIEQQIAQQQAQQQALQHGAGPRLV